MLKSWMVIAGVGFAIALLANIIRPQDAKWFRRLERPQWLTFEKLIPGDLDGCIHLWWLVCLHRLGADPVLELDGSLHRFRASDDRIYARSILVA